MSKTKQVKVSIPEWAWEVAQAYYEKHAEELAAKKPPIRSTTGLITHWILISAKESSVSNRERLDVRDEVLRELRKIVEEYARAKARNDTKKNFRDKT